MTWSNGQTVIDANSIDFDPAKVNLIHFDCRGLDGDVTIFNNTSLSMIAFGGNGYNMFQGGTGIDEFIGGPKSNSFQAGAGYDVMVGGTGSNDFCTLYSYPLFTHKQEHEIIVGPITSLEGSLANYMVFSTPGN